MPYAGRGSFARPAGRFEGWLRFERTERVNAVPLNPTPQGRVLREVSMLGRALGVIAAAMVIAALTACQADDREDIDPAVSPDQTVEVLMTDIAFAPAEVEVEAGRQIRLLFRNEGVLTHDFTIREMPHGDIRMMGSAPGDGHMHEAQTNAIHVAVDPGTTATLDLETTQAGTFEFFCSVLGHREAGMAGFFTVR